ncbi:MAG: metallophosphoesterase [Pseudomonadota bacterium]
MSALRYVCVSDLHLGAEDSLLTTRDKDGTVRDVPGDTLLALAKGLRATLTPLAGETPPTLVFMGDVLDLGLSTASDVSRAFLAFLDALFPAGEAPLFANDVIVIPGNHDHHLWRMARDERLLEHIWGQHPHALGQDADLECVSPLLDPPNFACRYLTGLMRMRPHLKDAEARIAYPNLGFVDGAGDRAVVLHHGHYLDATYRALSRLKGWLEASGVRPDEIADLERENGPWVDFLWSNLGDAGDIGKGINTLYGTLLDASASHGFALTLADRIVTAMSRTLGIREDMELGYGVTLVEAVRAAIGMTAGRAANAQREGYYQVMSADEIDDLVWYVEEPVARQFRAESQTGLAATTSFVFGHTHKPFQDQIAVPGYGTPVRVYNTGGWVLDRPTAMACQGGAMVLIDDALNVASLRLFNDPVNEAMIPVHAGGVGGFDDTENELLAALEAAVEGAAADWGVFSKHMHDEIRMHAERALHRFFAKDEV